MLPSSLIVLFAASSFVNGLPALFQRDHAGVASVSGLDALQGALGNTTGLDAPGNTPGAEAVVAPADNAAGHKVKENKAGGKATKHKGDKKKGHKHAKGSNKADLVANNTTALGAANNTLADASTESVNGTAIATEALANATATNDVGANTVTVTVTVTEAQGAGATSTEAASSNSVAAVAAAQTPDTTSLTNTPPTSAATQAPVYPGQAASEDSVDDEDDD